MTIERNPVPKGEHSLRLRCMDFDASGARIRHECEQKRLEFVKKQEERLALGKKPKKFRCPNRVKDTGQCSTWAFLYPRKWSTKGFFHFHQGIDIFAPAKTPIESVTGGMVVEVKTWDKVSEGYGNVVAIYDEHTNITFWYAHCQEVFVAEGTKVVERQVIATVGNSGFAEKPHLHFETLEGRWTDVGGHKHERELGNPRGPRLDPFDVLESLGPWSNRQLHDPRGKTIDTDTVALLHAEVSASPFGGHYPLGANNLWHGGVHLRMPLRSELHAPFDGEIVAVRIDPDPDAATGHFGSTNFVLLRHELPAAVFDRLRRRDPADPATPSRPAPRRSIGLGGTNAPDDVLAVKAALASATRCASSGSRTCSTSQGRTSRISVVPRRRRRLRDGDRGSTKRGATVRSWLRCGLVRATARSCRLPLPMREQVRQAEGVRGRPAGAWAGLWIGLVGCTSSGGTGGPAQPETAVGSTAIAVALPDGVEVVIDGQPRGRTPLRSIEVEPGAHAVVLATACARAELSVTVVEHQVATIDPPQVPGLAFASFEVTAKDRDGKPLPYSIAFGAGPPIDGGGGLLRMTVPACRQRVTVASAGLGAMIEDVAFEAGKTVVREVVLVPGPDMVRIEGGAFRMGPPGPSYWDPEYDGIYGESDYNEEEEDEDRSDRTPPGRWRSVHVFDVSVATFDIDRTEVTTAQFHECRKAGGCPWDPVKLAYTEFPPDKEDRWCTTDVSDQWRSPREGMGNHPMNCLPEWEAESYCTWVGKRLPTEVEWEFAARSRKVDYYCPWGPLSVTNHERSCRRRERTPSTDPVCTYPAEDTEQGLCDMMSNVAEYTKRVPERVPLFYADGRPATRGASNFHPFSTTFEETPYQPMTESIDRGFRCTRDVPAARTAPSP